MKRGTQLAWDRTGDGVYAAIGPQGERIRVDRLDDWTIRGKSILWRLNIRDRVDREMLRAWDCGALSTAKAGAERRVIKNSRT
jgi:hypothetical protein